MKSATAFTSESISTSMRVLLWALQGPYITQGALGRKRTAEEKLDAISQAIEELARAVDDIDRRVKTTEALASAAANRR